MPTQQSIPDVGSDLDSHTLCLKAIKEAVELGQGRPREASGTYVSFERAVQLGLMDTLQTLFVPKKPAFLDLLLNSPWIVFNSGAPVLGVTFSYPGYYRDALGRVFIRGIVSSGTSATAIATLPVGFRPQYRHMFTGVVDVGAGDAFCRVDVGADGVISFQGAGTANYLSLDGISFAAFQ